MNPLEPLADLPPWEWPEGASELVLQALRSGDAAVRLEAAENAWYAMSDEVAHELLRALRDRDPEVAGTAALSLGPVLEEHDTGEGDLEPLTTSRATFDDIVVELEVTWRDASVPPHVRRRVLEAAVRAHGTWQADAARAHLVDPDPDWRATAVFCCAWLAGFDDEILAALRDPELRVRYEAVRAAGERELHGAAGEIARLAVDPDADRDLRLVAVGALGSLQAEEASSALVKLLDDPDDEIAEAAEEAIGHQSMLASLEGFGVGDLDGGEGDDPWG